MPIIDLVALFLYTCSHSLSQPKTTSLIKLTQIKVKNLGLSPSRCDE